MSQKEKLILKICIAAFAIIAFGHAIVLAVAFLSENQFYYSLHFALPVCLFSIGIIAFLLPIATKDKYSSNQHQDNLMMVVAVLLILIAVFTLIFSYLNISF